MIGSVGQCAHTCGRPAAAYNVRPIDQPNTITNQVHSGRAAGMQVVAVPDPRLDGSPFQEHAHLVCWHWDDGSASDVSLRDRMIDCSSLTKPPSLSLGWCRCCPRSWSLTPRPGASKAGWSYWTRKTEVVEARRLRRTNMGIVGGTDVCWFVRRDAAACPLPECNPNK